MAGMAILPCNLDPGAFRLVHADMLRLDRFVRQFRVLLRRGLARCLFRNESNAFMAHTDIVTSIAEGDFAVRLRRVKYPSACKMILIAPQAITVTTHGPCCFSTPIW